MTRKVSRQTPTQSIRLQMEEREALFRRFGYDSAASLRFILKQALPLPAHVLEVGTGKGRFLAELARHAERVTTLDVDPEQQRVAKLYLRTFNFGCRIKYTVGNAEKLPWPSASFDMAVSVNTFHHLQRPKRVLEEMLRVLKPGGRLFLSDLSPGGFQIFDRIHRAEGRTHPRLKRGLAVFLPWLRKRGLTARRSKGFNQEILVASVPPAIVKGRSETE